MGKNKYTLLFLLFLSCIRFSQAEPHKYIVYFKDKPVDKNVESHFNAKALEKRKKFNIAFDERDYVVNPDYVQLLKNMNVQILNTSNWLNAVLIADMYGRIEQIQQLPFVRTTEKVEKTHTGGIASVTDINACDGTNEILDFENNYSSSFPQFHLLNGEYLHEKGFNGENMTIAICDNGFYNANNNPAFSHIFSQNRLLGTYSYVHGDSSVYNLAGGKHGAYCFSFIGGLKDNQYIGTATKANFYLFQTENDNSGIERLQEELNLAIALERCSQIGVDVVSISLGYMYFDVTSEDYDTTDIKTNNTAGAKAVNIAVSKGIIVCSAAGNNDGNGPYIVSPGCADSAIAVSSVDVNGVFANTSQGVPGDPRIKPNLAAVGRNASFIDYTGVVSPNGQGTSFATPSLAGMSACLWQAFPAKTNWEIKTAIEQSASQYLTPDKKIGYGIPDFERAYNLLANPTFVSNKTLENEIAIYPNPFQTTVNIVHDDNIHIRSIEVLNSIGQNVYRVDSPAERVITLSDLSKGMYLLQIDTDKGMLIKKIIKE